MESTTTMIFLCICTPYRPIARSFRRGVTWVFVVYVYIYNHASVGGLGACSLRKFLEMRFSEIASEVI